MVNLFVTTTLANEPFNGQDTNNVIISRYNELLRSYSIQESINGIPPDIDSGSVMLLYASVYWNIHWSDTP